MYSPTHAALASRPTAATAMRPRASTRATLWSGLDLGFESSCYIVAGRLAVQPFQSFCQLSPLTYPPPHTHTTPPPEDRSPGPKQRGSRGLCCRPCAVQSPGNGSSMLEQR
eukprot:282493-Chlamydomonas_euryale.AAC.1